MRIDRFLWFTRLARSRTTAKAMAEARHLRLDGRVIDRAHATVRIGNVLTLPLHGDVRVFRIEALPLRRGPPAEARACYAELTPGRPVPVDAPTGGSDDPVIEAD